MNTGKTLFAQLMDFLPWTTFTRIVDRYGGDHRVRMLSCAEQYRSMAFAQLTYRESLRDIETCLSVHASKLYHMGFRQPVRRSTLADANERRDWRIHAALAQRLITQARTLYVDEELGLDLTNTVYALDYNDHRSVPVGLSVGALLRTTKAAVKIAHAARPAGNIPSFIHISDGKLHDVHVPRYALAGTAGAIYVVASDGFYDPTRANASYVTAAKPAALLRCTRAKPEHADASSRLFGADGSLRPASFATRPSRLRRLLCTPSEITPNFCRRIRFKDPVIVGGRHRGVVAACCYIARTYGVRSAMPMFKALKACPDAVVVKPDMNKYTAVGAEVRSMMLDLTPLVEPLSIDEAFMDLSGTESPFTVPVRPGRSQS